MFKHYLITRFNLRFHKWNSTKNNAPLLDDNWMESRLRLFKNYCFSSVVNQSSKNFQWLIYLDKETKPKYKEEIADLVKEYSFVKPLYIDGMLEFKPKILEYIKEDSKGFSHIITSRIDNDDCLHKDYIKEIQASFDGQSFQLVDSIKGYVLQIEPIARIGKKEHLFNPFESLIEKNSNSIKTIWDESPHGHPKWKGINDLKVLNEKRLWICVVHDKNKVNEFGGYGQVNWDDVKNDFIINKEEAQWISGNLVNVSQWEQESNKNKQRIDSKISKNNFKRKIGLYKLKKLFFRNNRFK